MKKYQSSYVFKQIKKKRICEKKIHMDFPYGFSVQLDTRPFWKVFVCMEDMTDKIVVNIQCKL